MARRHEAEGEARALEAGDGGRKVTRFRESRVFRTHWLKSRRPLCQAQCGKGRASPLDRRELESVPFVDLKRQFAPLMPRIQAAMQSVVERCAFINGPEVREFEKKMASWLRLPDVCAVSNGTHALCLALRALGIGAGDEVITAPNTAFPTSEAIHLAGARVVFADIEKDSFNLDPEAVRACITPRTRAILPIHLYGIPAAMQDLGDLAREHGLFVVEDCAQAQGARYRGRPVGSMGAAGCYSFFPSKNLGTFGDGGAVSSTDEQLVRRVRMLANHGRQDKFSHEFMGTNSRLVTLKAAQLAICLEALDDWNDKRRRAAALYEELLAPFEEIQTPQIPADCEAVWHLYVIRHARRDALAADLKARGVQTGLHYPLPLHLQPAYRERGWSAGCFPHAEKACREVLSLPMFPEISAEEIETVAKAIEHSLVTANRG